MCRLDTEFYRHRKLAILPIQLGNVSIVQAPLHISPIPRYSARGESRNFGKWGPGDGAKPRTERRRRERRRGVWGPPPKKFEELDAISCHYIFGIRMASDIIQNLAFAEQKTIAATISKPINVRQKKPTDLFCRPMGSYRHTLTHTPDTSKNSSDFATIKSKFNFKNIFPDMYTM